MINVLETKRFGTVLDLKEWLDNFQPRELRAMGFIGMDVLEVRHIESELSDGSLVSDISFATDS